MVQVEVRVADGPSGPAHAPSHAAAHSTDHGRRAALARLAGLCALSLSAEALAALAAPRDTHADKAALEVLTRAELALTGVLAELIIPRTDTPGALAVGAHRTIDHLLAVGAGAPARDAFRAGLARIEALARAETGKRFGALPSARQIALLTAIDSGAAPFTRDDQKFFGTLKQYTLFAYCTSEAGATRLLAYLPVPGGYRGNVKVTKTTRTWAL